jgi:gliding motility-associated-like protein
MPSCKYLLHFTYVTFILLLCLFPDVKCLAQAPNIEWQKTYGGTDNDEAEKIIQTNDGGYIIIGWTYSNNGDVTGQHPGGTGDCWIIKTDPVGNISWKKTIGGTGYEDGLDIKQTTDGGYIVCGHTSSNDADFANLYTGGSYQYDAFVAKLDATGNIQWIKTYGGAGYDVFISIEQTADGGYITSGYTSSNDNDVSGVHGDIDAWVVKLDGTGKIQWQKCVGGKMKDAAWCIKPTPDGNFVFTGFSESIDGDIKNSRGKLDIITGKLDAQGNLLWIKNFGGSLDDWGWRLVCTSDGGYVVAGYAFSSNGDITKHYGQNDIYLLKYDAQGNLLWQKNFGGYDYDDPYSLEQTADGGFIVGGRTLSTSVDVSSNHGNNDYWVFKVDMNGGLLWEKTLGGSKQDIAHSFIATSDGGYIVAGTSYSSDGDVLVNKGKSDIWVVKLGQCLLNTPDVPNQINGNSSPCVGTTVIYDIDPVNDATGYTWSVPAGWSIISGQGTTQLTVTVGTGSGQVDVLAYNTCKFSGKQILASTPTINTSPIITVKADNNNICKGSPVTFTAQTVNAASPTYQWKKNGNNVGGNSPKYMDNTLVNNDVINCEIVCISVCGGTISAVSPVIKMAVNDPVIPALTISCNQTTICKGTNIAFSSNSSNPGSQPQYTWYVNNVSTGSHSSSFSSSALADGDIVTCTLLSSENCVTSSLATSNPIAISVNSNTTAVITISTATPTICKGDDVTVEANISNAGSAPVYVWKLNNVEVGSNSPVVIVRNLSDQDRITCTITPGQNTCATQSSTSNIITIKVNPLPDIVILPADTIVKPGTQITFNSIINQPVRSFNWEPSASLTNNTSLNATTVPIMDETTYRLSVVSMDGCAAYSDARIKPLYSLNIPNAFTPNGDGKNDLFRIPPHTHFDLTQLKIYNRWGQVVFSTNQISSGWDGRFNGIDQASGTFIYQISGVLNGKQIFLKGSLTLVR